MAFHTNANGHSIYGAIAALIPPKGIAQKDLQKAFTKQCSQDWNPSSVSPALSYLEKLGVIKREGNRLERSIKLKRRYRVEDDAAISEQMKSYQNKRRSAPAKRGNGAIPFTSTKFMVAVGQKDTVVLDGKQAYALWKELNQIFGGRS